jgi:hypothetical protein
MYRSGQYAQSLQLMENRMFKNLTVSWHTTVSGMIPLIAYALNYFGLWPSIMPLPPIDQVWPFVVAVLGIGAYAKDANVTGGKISQE